MAEQLQAFVHDRRFESVLCNDLSREGPEHLQKITLRGPEEELMRFRLEQSSEVSGVEMVFSGDTCLEVIPQGVDKGKGVRITADYMKVSLDDIVAVGDAIVSGLPVPTYVPPQLLVYHLTSSPEPPVTERFIFPASFSQKLFASEDADVGATGSGTTVTVTLTQDDSPQVFSQRA